VATTTDNTTAWLRRYHRSDAAVRRLVCFPHAGGAASFFLPVAARFSPAVDVIAIQYPGRQDRRHEQCVGDIATLADLIADQLRKLEVKPTVFFGHSMGSAVAFETAWRLERDNLGPRVLVASGYRAPSIRFDHGVHCRDDDGVVAEIRRLDGTDAGLLADEDVLRMALPAIRGDYRAIENYVAAPDRVLACPITTLIGDADPEVDLEQARSWASHSAGTFRLKVFPGGHFYLVAQQAGVGEEIAYELDRC